MHSKLLLCGSLFSSLLVAAGVFAAPAIYTGGHADIGVSYVNGDLAFRYDLAASAILDGVAIGVKRYEDPENIVTRAGAAAYREITGPLESYFPGATHGYFLGREASSTSPYLGIGADDPTLTSTNWVAAPGLPFAFMDYRITSVVYTGAAQNPQVLYYDIIQATGELHILFNRLNPGSTSTGYSGISLPILNAHAHPNWGFSDAGIYDITWTASATHATNGLETATGVFRFEMAAVPEPSSLHILGLGALGMLRRRWGRA